MLIDTSTLVLFSLAFPFIGTAITPIIAKFGNKARTYFAVIIGFLTAAIVMLLLPEIWMGRSKGLEYSVDWTPSINLSFSLS